ncbi:MAG: hypothetical protein ACTIDO_17905 [Brevibacterium aurantiacum]|uniref:hypothetical protein n=1 Tax=Brevibacterium aurantiacum TaxID=273384 RepID=UPI003F8FB8D7
MSVLVPWNSRRYRYTCKDNCLSVSGGVCANEGTYRLEESTTGGSSATAKNTSSAFPPAQSVPWPGANIGRSTSLDEPKWSTDAGDAQVPTLRSVPRGTLG